MAGEAGKGQTVSEPLTGGRATEELSRLLKEALQLKRGSPPERKDFDKRGDDLWAQTQDTFLREALQGMWDYSSEYLDWGDPAEQLPLRIDLHLLKHFDRVDSQDLCRCRKIILKRIVQKQGRISVSEDMLSHHTLLDLSEQDDDLVAGYDLSDLDQMIETCLLEKGDQQ